MTTMPVPPPESLALRTIAMPADTNPQGDMFGGWMVSQMDLAAGNVASFHAKGRIVTVAIEALSFQKPVFVGDEISCYAELIKVGKTSMTIKVQVWVRRALTHHVEQVTEGTFVFVAVDAYYQPRAVPPLSRA